MPIATTGLILRQIKVGEADRILTILTPDLGVISASAKGSMRLKNKLFSATGLFCYSEFSLTSGRNHYFIDTAQIKNVFHGISATVEGMGLASYMAEIAAELSPAPPESEAQLRLLLNCLYMLSEQKRPVRMLKVIYELRSMTLAGYMPDVLACSGCGKYDECKDLVFLCQGDSISANSIPAYAAHCKPHPDAERAIFRAASTQIMSISNISPK